jgi:hypothetical protein
MISIRHKKNGIKGSLVAKIYRKLLFFSVKLWIFASLVKKKNY